MNKAMITTAALALALAACKGAEPAEPYSPALVPSGTGDTGGYIDPLAFGTVEAAEMRIVAWFGWDSALGEIVSIPSIDGDTNSTRTAEFYMWLYAAGWQDASEADQEKMICHVGIELEGMNSMDTVDDGRFWGLLMEDGIQRAHETCIGDGFDSNQFLNQDPIEQYAGQNWEIQLGGDLEASTATWLTDSYGDDDDFNIDHYWGATLVSDDYEPDFEDNFFRGWRMDPNTYDVGSTDYMTKYEYDIGGELATGLYLFDQNIYWNVGPVD